MNMRVTGALTNSNLAESSCDLAKNVADTNLQLFSQINRRAANLCSGRYNSTFPTVGFASTLGDLSGTSCSPPSSTGACLIDTQLSSGTKSGYSFALSNVTGTPASTYMAIGTPLTPNQTGVRYFCSFADAVVRYSATSITTCTTSNKPLQ
jgi:hypothetical protein